ncbi:hypothetical protein ACHAW6_008517 [Cyclotella cf. meneghiniana]
MTYTQEFTGEALEDKKKFIYFAEKGGWSPGVDVRDKESSYFTVFQGVPKGRYQNDETVGIALSPDRRKLYTGFQESGVLFEFTRDDKSPFEKHHTMVFTCDFLYHSSSSNVAVTWCTIKSVYMY